MSKQTNKVPISPASELAQLRTRTLWQTVSDAARRDPRKCALVAAADAGDVQRLSYERLLERAGHLSAGLASVGVRRGDRVVLWMTNTPEWVLSALAIMRLGAAVVPINTFLKPVEVEYVIAQSGARHLLMLDVFRKLRLPAMLGEICPEFIAAKAPGFLQSNTLPDLRNVVLFGRSGIKHEGAFDLGELEALGARDERAQAFAERMQRETCSSDLGMIKYTSGSTGFPKGVMLEQGGIVANGTLHSRRIGVGSSDVYFSMMPFFHAGGSIYGLMTMLVNGGTLVFTEAFNASLAADLVVAEQASVFVTMLGDEVVQAALAKGVVCGSVRVADLPNEAARKVMPNVKSCFHAFGLTETYGPVALSSFTPGNCDVANGRPLEGNETRIVDPETLEDLPPGVPGELLVRGNLARGYWNKPVETARAFIKDGWFRSEDLVSIDADGYLTWHGRLKLMLKIGGENVSIEEVERVVTSHDAIAACCAVGVPDQRKREAIRLYVQMLSGQVLSEAELLAWLKPRLAHFKLPREIAFIDMLPRLGSGKVDRVQLARLAKAEAQP
jgi:fatty-acyl-CoA synthase